VSGATGATRPGIRMAVQNSLVLTRRRLIKLRTDPEQLIGIVAQPVLFVVLFVYVLGGAMAQSRADYLQYVMPGILVQGIVFATMGTGFALNSDIAEGIFDRLRSLPIARSAPLVGQILGDLVRFAVSAVVILVLGVVFGFRIRTGPVQVVAALALVLAFAFALCWVSGFAGLAVRGPQGVATVGVVWFLPLTFGSSVLAPLRTLPGWLQAWASINPVSSVSNAVRGLLAGGPVARPALAALGWIAAILLVFVPLSLRAYRRRV
jgi:oleandomycin transport system permease protein